MSFGGKSFKKEELSMKRELQQLSRQSKSEYSDLSINDKAKLRLENLKRHGAKPVQGNRSEKTSAVEQVGAKSERIITGPPEVEKDEWNNENLSIFGEIPPPSPSIDLGPELRSSLGTETPLTVTTPKETDLVDSVAFNRRRSDLISRSTGVASIRSRANFSVVMHGKGIADINDTSSAGKIRGKKSAENPQSETPPRKTPQQEEKQATKKPAIIGSQSTAVAVQLTRRPTPRQTQRPLSRRSNQGHVESHSSSARFDEVAHSTTPAQLDELDDRVKILHTPEDNTDNSYRNDGLEVREEGAADNGTEAEVIADVPKDIDRDDKHGGSDCDSKREDTLSPDSGKVEGDKKAHEVEEEKEENQIDRIHSEILELTRKISLPDAGILKFIRASEEATDKAKNQQEMGVGSQPSKEILLLKALAQQGGTDFAVSGALKSTSPPRVSRTPVATKKNEKAQGGQSSITDKEDLLEIPRKDARATLASGGTTREGSPGLSGAPSSSEIRETEEGKREFTDRGILASQSGHDFVSRLDLTGQRTVTDEQALESLLLPLEVVPEDIIGIKGQQVEIVSRGLNAPVNSVEFVPQEVKKQWIQVKTQKDVTFLDSWQIKESDKLDKGKQPVKTHNIHHFCTMASRIELPPHLCRITRDEHTPDRFPMVTGRQAEARFRETLPEVNEEETEGKDSKEKEDGSSETNKQTDAEARRRSLAAEKILREASELGDSDEIMARLKKASDSLFSTEVEEPLDIVGVKMQLKDDTSRLYWTPAPPKMNLAPATIKSQLYPDYQGASMLQESLATEQRTATGIDSDDNDETQADLDSGDLKAKTRILSRAHGSMSDLHKLVSAEADQVQRPKTDLGGVGGHDSLLQTKEISDSEERTGTPDRFMSVLDRRREHIKQQDEELREDVPTFTELTDKNIGPTILRSTSHPQLFVNEKFLKVPAGYDISMDELNYQRDQVAAVKAKRQEKEEKDGEKDVEQIPREKSVTAVTVSSRGRSTIMDFPEPGRDFESDGARTETENMSAQTATSRATGLTKMSKRRLTHRKVRRKTKRDLEREQEIYEFVNQPARPISRSKSFTEIRSLEREEKQSYAQRKESVSSKVDLGRASSVPTLHDLEKFLNEDLSGPSDDVFDDIRQRFWYVWFDEVYPPTPAALDIKFDLRSLSTPRAESRSKASVVIVNNDILDEIQVIEPQVSSTDQQLYQALQEEVVTLTDLIDNTVKKESCAIHLCRRGAVYRKLGQLKNAWDDLNRSIELEPKLLDAYWYRHLLHLLQDNIKAALADLTFIIKNNSNQARAFRSRAELYRQESDATMAIVNYSQAIKLDPNDAETYYQRAAMFKMRGDMILALEDYKIAAKLLPSKTDAMSEIGVYHFNNQNWIAAVNDFTEVLRQDPENSKAYSHRARVHAKMVVVHQ